MKLITTDFLNIILLCFSGILSVFYPLQTFVLAYFILGPLHYITEVAWLDKKDFYIKKDRFFWMLFSIISSFLISFIIVYSHVKVGSFCRIIIYNISKYTNSLLIFGVLYPLIGLYFTQKKYKNTLKLILFLAVLFGNFYFSKVFYELGLFLPTLVHVYLFTLLFMMYGVYKQKTILGYISVFLLLLIPMVYVVLPYNLVSYNFPQSHKDFFLTNKFHFVLAFLGKHLGVLKGDGFYFYEKTELRLLMFMSFAYLHHYLNWFAKTSITQWNKAFSTLNILVVILVWIVLITMIYFKISIALFLVVFMSFLHLFLEFPLNGLTIKKLLLKS